MSLNRLSQNWGPVHYGDDYQLPRTLGYQLQNRPVALLGLIPADNDQRSFRTEGRRVKLHISLSAVFTLGPHVIGSPACSPEGNSRETLTAHSERNAVPGQ